MVEYPPQPEPIRVEIEPTNICNAKCTFCPRWNINRPMGFLDLEELSKFLDKLDDYRHDMWINQHNDSVKYPRLVFAGIGEPTLHPRIIDIIKEGSRRGFDTELVTNGAKLNGKLAYKLADAGLYRLSISLHSLHPQIYNTLMKLRLDKTLPHISEALKVLDDTNVEVEIWKVSHPNVTPEYDKVDDEKRFREFTSQYKKKIEILGPTVAWNRGGQLRLNDYPKVHDSDDVWCQLLYFTLNVSWDGTGVMCCCDYSQITVPLGNAWKEPIDVLQSRRNQIFQGYKQEQICQDCRRSKDNTYELNVYPTLNISTKK